MEKNDDNKRFWSRCAGVYEKTVKLGKSARRSYNEVEAAIGEFLMPGMSVLELAAGPGVLSLSIAEKCAHLTVTDFSPEMVEKARVKLSVGSVASRCSFAVADATALTFPDASFNAVVIANALHIMPNPVAALAEIKRVLTSDGIIIAPTFTRVSAVSGVKERIMELAGFKTFSRWTHEQFCSFLQDQGFEIVHARVIEGNTFPESFVVCRVR